LGGAIRQADRGHARPDREEPPPALVGPALPPDALCGLHPSGPPAGVGGAALALPSVRLALALSALRSPRVLAPAPPRHGGAAAPPLPGRAGSGSPAADARARPTPATGGSAAGMRAADL